MKIKHLLKFVFSSHKNKVIEKCDCPCHDGQPWISHFMPCCKYTGQQIKK